MQGSGVSNVESSEDRSNAQGAKVRSRTYRVQRSGINNIQNTGGQEQVMHREQMLNVHKAHFTEESNAQRSETHRVQNSRECDVQRSGVNKAQDTEVMSK